MSENHYIYLNGEKIPVSEEVYRAMKRDEWREEKRKIVRDGREISLDYILDETGGAIPSGDAFIEEIIEDKFMFETLYAALAELSDDVRAIIDALFFQKKSERETAREMRIPRTILMYQIEKILDKLRKYFD